jgi:hypothetical protein
VKEEEEVDGTKIAYVKKRFKKERDEGFDCSVVVSLADF